MTTVWKYLIDVRRLDKKLSSLKLEVPQGARFLSADVQRGDLCVWAAVDSDAPMMFRTIYVFGTGQPFTLPPDTEFIGTVLLFEGTVVLHFWATTP